MVKKKNQIKKEMMMMIMILKILQLNNEILCFLVQLGKTEEKILMAKEFKNLIFIILFKRFFIFIM